MEGSSDEIDTGFQVHLQDAFVERDRRECKRDCIVLSGFCACPTTAKGDKWHELEKRRKYTSYTSTCKIVVVGLMSDKKEKLLFIGF